MNTVLKSDVFVPVHEAGPKIKALGYAPDIELIRADELNDAYDRVEKGDVRFRYVIDLASLKSGDRQ